MAIFVDRSEVRSNTTMPYIQGAIIVDNLEEITGCDFMLSRMAFPATTEELIKMHIQNGALLVQRKHGRDLSSSVGERMNSSLARMREIGATQCQCVLLFIGMLTEQNGEAIINRQNTKMQFFQVQSAISRWHDRGGVVETLHKASLVEQWCNMKVRHLEEYAEKPEREFFPDNPSVHKMDKVLQVLMPVKDARITLCTFPGIGEKTATLLMDEFIYLSDAMAWLTFPDTKDSMKIKGIGKKTKEKAREWLGLPDVMVMHVEMNEILQERVNKNG